MDVTEIVKETKGRKLHFFDSWDCQNTTITVESAHIGDRETMFVGENQWGKKDRIYIPNRIVDDILCFGKAVATQVVEYCTVIKRYELM